MIADGRVKINNKLVTALGTCVGDGDVVSVDGKIVRPVTEFKYIMLYKPKGCVTTRSDEKGRKTVYDYQTVDQLDGVGLEHGLPSREADAEAVPDPVDDLVDGEVPEHKLAQLRKGVVLDDGVKTSRSKVKLVEFADGVSKLQVVISEGKNRQVRRMFAAVGEEVTFLKRIAVGAIRLGGLSRGAYRYLNDREIAYIKSL